MEHLNPEAVEALLRGDPAVLTHFREHLARPCEVCEEFLMGEHGFTLLDGRVDEVLLHLSPASAQETSEASAASDAGFERVARGFRKPPRWRSATVGFTVALAAAALVVLVPRARHRAAPRDSDLEGVKGSPAAVQVELLAAVRSADGQLRRVDRGAAVASSEVVLFRYRASGPATAYLLARHGDGEPEVLGRFELAPGEDDLRTPEGLAGLPLTGEHGRITFWLVAGGPELSPDEARRQVVGPGAWSAATAFPLRVEVGKNAQ